MLCTWEPNSFEHSRQQALYSSHRRSALQADGLHPDCDCARGFVLLITMHVYSSAAATFYPLPNMPTGMPFELLNAIKALQVVDQGKPGPFDNVC